MSANAQIRNRCSADARVRRNQLGSGLREETEQSSSYDATADGGAQPGFYQHSEREKY